MIDISNNLLFQVHGASSHGSGGFASAIESVLTFMESLVGLTPTEIFAVIFPGMAAMANIHPLVVHFPIAFLSAFLLTDFLGTLLKKDNWRHFASGLLYFGTIAAMGAVAAGLAAEASVEHGENVHMILERHETIGVSVLALSLFLSVWRLLSGGLPRGIGNVFFLLFAVLLNTLIMFGADLGGLMVYKYGVAVEAVELTTLDYFHEHSHSH